MPKSHYSAYLLIFHYICSMILFENIDWTWIEQNMHADTTRLRLSAHGDEKRLFEITQIDCRQRVKTKLADTLSSLPRFIFPSTLSAQQSTSDLLASYHADLTNYGWQVLDMTGGLGIDARHICQKAKKITICDINQDIAICAKENFRQSGAGNIEVLNCDSVNYIAELSPDSFDCIFIDPARRGSHGERLYALSQCAPDVTTILHQMLQVAPNVIIKASPMLDISHTISELHNVKEIIALGTHSECKELVIICQRNFDGITTIKSVTLTKQHQFCVEFPYNSYGEQQHIAFCNPKKDDILYEPYPSLLKIGEYKSLCKQFNVNKIAADTHFFHSGELNTEFPGIAHRIIWIEEMNKKTLRELPKLYPELDVTTKNFPMTSAELSDRLRVRPSGFIRLFACRNSVGKKILIVGQRL